MKKNCFPGTLVLLFVLLGNCSFAQDFSNKGKDFWVGYGYHQVMNAGNGQNMVLYFATDQVTNITISIPGTGYTQNITSPAGNNIITSAIIPKAGMQDARLMTEGIQNKGIHITSDKPMVAYAHIYNASVSGSCLLFPTNTLGKEYYSINFKNISNSDPANCWFYVVAVDTGTTSVEITPSANTVGGWQAGNTYTVNLTQGQIYNVMGILTGNSTPCGPNTFTGVDLTGSKIRSISASGVCKRIGVFSGSGRISITSTDCQSSSDNYMVQSFPKSAWGKKYLTTPTEGATNNMGSNYFRICVADPTTVVRVNGAIITGLTNNFYYELSPTKIPNLIEADKPITVAQYITTQGQFNNGSPGDPEMIYLSPVEQTISKVIFNSNLLVATPSSSHQHNVSVVIPNGGTALSSFRLDGATPPVPFTVHPQDPGYSYIKISGLSQGQHIIESDSGFNAIAYGYAQAESYGYNAGTNVKDLFQFISVRNQYATVNFPATCKGSPFYFSMTFPYEPTQIQWVFGAALNTMGIADVTLNNPVFDSSWTVSGKQLYRYKLPTPYTISNSGTYPIRVNATNPTPDGCSGNQEIDFDVQVFDPPTADFNFNTNGCITSPVQFTDNSAGNGRTINNWFWSFGDGNNNTSNNNPTHTYNAAGSYLVKYAIRTDVGCISDTASRTVVLNNAPLAKFGLTTPLCAGKPVTFSDTSTASGSNTLVKWTWNFGEGTPVIATNNASQTHTYSNPGVYTASLQVETSSGCASTVFSRQITINANPVAGFNLPAICMPSGAAQFNDQSTVAGGTISAWNWDFGDGNSSSNQNPLHIYSSTGPFNVSLAVTSNAGCTSSKTQLLNTVFAEPQAAFTSSAEVCIGNPVSFTDQSSVTGGTVNQWSWNFGDGNTSSQQNPSHTFSSAGTYTVTLNAQSSQGCPTVNNIATRTVTVNPLPVADFSIPLNGCVNRNLTITDASLVNAGTITKWNWNFGDGNNSLLTSGNPFTHNYTSAGSYNITLQVESNKGCVSTVVAKPIEINILPRAAFAVPEACLSDVQAPFSDSSTIASGSINGWSWNFGDPNANASNPNVSVLQNPTHHYTMAGPYTATLVAISDKGCTDTLSRTFVVNGSLPQAVFAVQNTGPLCSNADLSIKDGSTVDIGSLVRMEIFWDYVNDPTNKLVDDDPVPGKIYTHRYPEFGSPASRTVTIRYIAYSGASCFHIQTQTITLLATPSLQFGAVPGVCEDAASFPISQASLLNGLPGTGLFSGPGVTANGLFNPSIAGAGRHTITYTYNAANGCSNAVTSTIEVNPKPGINAGPDKVVLQGGAVTLTPSLNQGVPVSYLWSPATGLNDPTLANPSASPADDITYTLTVTSDKNCSASDQVFVKVLKAPAIPNIFSPNGDNIHDRWEIAALESYPGCTVDVYNRYGQLVFHSVGYSRPWDGKVNGKDVPVGTYYYVIDPKNGRNKIAGYVDVIR